MSHPDAGHLRRLDALRPTGPGSAEICRSAAAVQVGDHDKENVHYRAIGAFEIEQVFLPGLSFPNTRDPADVAQAKRTITPDWRDHVEVRQFKATSFFAM